MSKKSIPIPKMRRGIRGFYKDVVSEMRHVTWPGPQETSRLTTVVLSVCLGVVLMLFGMSVVVEQILKILLGSG